MRWTHDPGRENSGGEKERQSSAHQLERYRGTSRLRLNVSTYVRLTGTAGSSMRSAGSVRPATAARFLGLPRGTVNSRLRRGLDRLGDALREELS